MMSDSCRNDLDCEGTQVCYVNISWLPNKSDLCQCSTFYGWEGANCSDYGPGSYFQLASASCQFFCAILLLFLSLLLYSKIKQQEKKCCSIPMRVFFFMVLGLVSLAIWRVVSIVVVLSPDDLTLKLELESPAGKVYVETYNPITPRIELRALVACISATMFALANKSILCTSPLLLASLYFVVVHCCV